MRPTEDPADYGLSAAQYAKVSAFMDAACVTLPLFYRPDCCIAATAIACDVLGGWLHMKLRPLAVQIEIANPAIVAQGRWPADQEEYRRWQTEYGAWWVSLGDPAAEGPGWSGHLVAVVYGTAVIDLSLPQASRPAKGIVLPAVLFEAGPGFLEGQARDLGVNGSLLVYRARPDDRSYASAPDWQDARRRAPAVRAIRDRMRAALRP